ncbi:D-alanine--D-alanine ligase [candidate division WOR-3 bacterium]|nr:D-alanine--D-alanine ligase [candidate division WOR-3 bacterium]
MKVGITYDLREEYLAEGYGEEETAEFDRPDTIDGIENALRELGFETDCIGHIRNLVKRLAKGERWDLVFNIAEGMYGFGREAQVPALLDVYRIPYTFSGPMVLSLTLHKALTKRVVRDFGIPTPDFLQVRRPKDIAKVELPYPLFAKPVAEGTGKGISPDSRIAEPTQLDAVCRRLLAEFDQPVLVETFMPGREFTVGIVGTGPRARTLAVMEVEYTAAALGQVYGYVNKEECESRIEYRLADDATARQAAEIALAAWRILGCRDGGRVDLRCAADGVPNFLEVNPLAGLNPVHSDLPIMCTLAGIGFRELLGMIVESTRLRVGWAEDV